MAQGGGWQTGSGEKLMSLLIFCISLLLIASVLGLLIDCTGILKLGLFMASICIHGNSGIFYEFSTDWAIGWLIGGFFQLNPALPCLILGFICETSFIKGFIICFSACILGFKLLLIPWTSCSF